MKTDVDACLRELVDWYIQHRRDITLVEMTPILQKHCGSDAEVQKFIGFLETGPGQARFRTLLRERKGEQPSYLKGKEVTKRFEVTFASKRTGERRSIIVEAPDEIEATPIARKQLGLDKTEWTWWKTIFPKEVEGPSYLKEVSAQDQWDALPSYRQAEIMKVAGKAAGLLPRGGKVYWSELVPSEREAIQRWFDTSQSPPAKPNYLKGEEEQAKIARPKFVDEAIRAYQAEGDRGLSQVYRRLSGGEKKSFDSWLVSVKHPLAYRPGDVELRFRSYVLLEAGWPGVGWWWNGLSVSERYKILKELDESELETYPFKLPARRYMHLEFTSMPYKTMERIQKYWESQTKPSYLKEAKKGRRTAYYVQYWSPKSEPEMSQPYYWGDAYSSLREALDAANDVEEKKPEAFGAEVYSQEEEWVPYEEHPQLGRWEVIEGRMKTFDRRGAVIHDEAGLGKPSYLREPAKAEAPSDPECQIISPKYYSLLSWFNIPAPDYAFAIEPEARERKIDAVLQQLKDGVSRIHESAVFREFLLTMSKFHEYSFGNQILIMLQRPSATKVAGYRTWQELGRQVRGGEKSISILAPCLPPRVLTCPLDGQVFSGERELRAHIQQAHPSADVSALVRRARTEGRAAPTPTYFKVVSVFDIAQTDGKPLPQFEVPTLSGAYSQELLDKLMRLAQKEGIAVSFEPRPGQDPDIKGTQMGKDIWVKPDEPDAQRLKTLAHEMAHYFTGVFAIPRADAEVIAESVAFVVSAHFGFDTGVRSFPYVALWAKEPKVLDQNLASVGRISDRMIGELGGLA